MEAIFKRRSIREYTNKQIDEEIIIELIKAGMAAPSAGNEQPWYFIIINQRTLLNKIQTIHPYSHMLSSAQAAILVCGDPCLEVHKGFWVQDCSAATENILISVTARNLGAVWLGIYPLEERVVGIQKLLHLPQHVIPFSLLPIGYPAEKKSPKTDFDISRIKYNGW